MARTLPRRSLIHPENPHCAAARECCTAASDQRLSTLREEAPAVARRRPTAVGLAVPRMGRLALVADHGQAGNSHLLASQRISSLLDVEDSKSEAWASSRATRSSRPHPPHEQ